MKKVLWMVGLCLLLVLMSIGGMGCGGQEEIPEVEEEEEHEEPEVVDDNLVTLKKMQPVCVVINNAAQARPHSGLQQASTVYEFLAEGGITRFLAVFDNAYEEDFVIGPIRSLRPYFGHQAVEYGGIVAHSGYSSRTREMIAGLGLKHINSSNFWRDSSRKAPHNLYAHMEKLRTGAGDDMQVAEETIEVEDLPEGYEEGREIEVVYSAGNKVTYTYDQASETYMRFTNGTPNKDRETDKQYYADRVIIRETRHENVSGSSLVNIYLEGEGTGYLYEQGRKYEIKWEKKQGDKTRYYYPDQTPVDIRTGTTWIQVVPINN